jgi:hypothetical protein
MGRSLNLRVDWGLVTSGAAAGTGTPAGGQKLHATLIWNFQ